MKNPNCPVDMKSDISLTVLHQSCTGCQMSYTSTLGSILYIDIWLYPQDRWEISFFALCTCLCVAYEQETATSDATTAAKLSVRNAVQVLA